MLERLYRMRGISDKTDFSALEPEDWPIAEDLYAVLENAYEHYDWEDSPLYPRELLRELLLGLHSMCRGAESVYFNGYTNITSARFLVFGVKDLIHANSSVKDALLFNLLSYLSDRLLTQGNTVAALDELYLWLSNLTTIEYIRNCLKRVRKRNSALILASQNLEDFDVQGCAGADPSPVCHPNPPVPLPWRQGGQEVLHGQPATGKCRVRPDQFPQ